MRAVSANRSRPLSSISPPEGSGTATYEPPFNPPAKERPAPVTLKNPIAAVHAQFAQFVMTHLAKGHATIGP